MVKVSFFQPPLASSFARRSSRLPPQTTFPLLAPPPIKQQKQIFLAVLHRLCLPFQDLKQLYPCSGPLSSLRALVCGRRFWWGRLILPWTPVCARLLFSFLSRNETSPEASAPFDAGHTGENNLLGQVAGRLFRRRARRLEMVDRPPRPPLAASRRVRGRPGGMHRDARSDSKGTAQAAALSMTSTSRRSHGSRFGLVMVSGSLVDKVADVSQPQLIRSRQRRWLKQQRSVLADWPTAASVAPPTAIIFLVSRILPLIAGRSSPCARGVRLASRSCFT